MELSKEKIIELYIKENISLKETAKLLGIGKTTLLSFNRKNRITKNGESKSFAISKERLENLYNSGKTMKEICNIVGVSGVTLHKLFKKYGIKTKLENKMDIVSSITKDEILKVYIEDNIILPDVAKKLGISETELIRLLKKFNISKPESLVNDIREKNNLKKYGKSFPYQLDKFKEKAKKTNMKKYGTEYPMQQEDLRIKHSNKNTKHKKNPLTKKVIEAFSNKESLEKYLKDHELLGKTVYEISTITGYARSIICKKIKEYGLKDKIEEKPKSSTEENQIVKFIESFYDKSIIRNSKDILGNRKELDIYLPDINFAIEFNGDFWHSIKYKGIDYHKSKIIEAKKNGITLFNVFSHEWHDEKLRADILNSIKNFITGKEKSFYSPEILINASRCNDNLLINDGYKLKYWFKPDYIWWKRDDDWMSRIQASSISDRLLKSEGYLKVYDCGYKYWIK